MTSRLDSKPSAAESAASMAARVQANGEPRGLEDLQRARERAMELLATVEAFDLESKRRVHATFVLCCLALAFLAAGAWSFAQFGPALGSATLTATWVPLVAGLLMLMVAGASLARGQAGTPLKFAIAVASTLLYVVAMHVNGAAPILFVPALVIFLHLLLTPGRALWFAGVVFLAPLLLLPEIDRALIGVYLPRAMGSGVFALVVLQLLMRRSEAFKTLTQRVTSQLSTLVETLSSELLAERDALDKVQRALAAQVAADKRLHENKQITAEALQFMSQGIAVFDQEGRLVLSNDRVWQLLDLDRNQFGSEPLISEVVAVQMRRGDFGGDCELVEAKAVEYLKARAQGCPAEAPSKYVRKSPLGRFIEVVTSPGESGRTVITYSDVTTYHRITEQTVVALAERDLQLHQALQARRIAEEAVQARKAAYAEREAAQGLLRMVLDAMSQGVLVFDPAGKLLLFNPRASELLSLPRGFLEEGPSGPELVSYLRQRGDLDVVAYDNPEPGRHLDFSFEKWRDYPTENYIRPSLDGRDIEVRSEFVLDSYLVRTYTDVTEHRKTIKALEVTVRERDEQLAAALAAREQTAKAFKDMLSAQNDRDRANMLLLATLETASHGVMATGPDGRVSFWNDKALQLLNLPAALLASKPLSSAVLKFQIDRGDFAGQDDVFQQYLQLVLKEEQAARNPSSVDLERDDVHDRDEGTPELLRVDLSLDSGEVGDLGGSAGQTQARKPFLPSLPVYATAKSQREANRYVRKTAQGRYLEVTRVPMPYGGDLRSYSDITDYVQANQKLEESLDRLRTAEMELKAELGRSQVALDLQSRFVASVSHEIRTPLNGIAGMAELLTHATLSPEHKAYLDDLRASTHQLRRLTDDILDLARLRGSKFTLQKRKFNVWQQVRSCTAAAQAVGRRKGLAVELQLYGQDVVAVGDPERFSQVLNNLLSNAVKFTHRGFVRVIGGWEPSDEDPSRIQVELSVADSGRGIDPKVIGEVFQPFHQGDDSTNRNYGGTGLGLALCRELCEAMEGDIQVTSRPDHGSVFSFKVSFLRVDGADEDMDTHPADLAELGSSLEGIKVLAVDDNRINQKLMQVWLSQAGAEVTLAFDGEEAFNLASSRGFDCILMDMSMPNMNGLQASQAIRALDKSDDPAQAVRAWVPIIGVTAMARREDRQLCLEAGMNAHLSKPVDRLELLRTVRRLRADAAWLKSAGGIYADAVSPSTSLEEVQPPGGLGLGERT